GSKGRPNLTSSTARRHQRLNGGVKRNPRGISAGIKFISDRASRRLVFRKYRWGIPVTSNNRNSSRLSNLVPRCPHRRGRKVMSLTRAVRLGVLLLLVAVALATPAAAQANYYRGRWGHHNGRGYRGGRSAASMMASVYAQQVRIAASIRAAQMEVMRAHA